MPPPYFSQPLRERKLTTPTNPNATTITLSTPFRGLSSNTIPRRIIEEFLIRFSPKKATLALGNILDRKSVSVSGTL